MLPHRERYSHTRNSASRLSAAGPYRLANGKTISGTQVRRMEPSGRICQRRSRSGNGGDRYLRNPVFVICLILSALSGWAQLRAVKVNAFTAPIDCSPGSRQMKPFIFVTQDCFSREPPRRRAQEPVMSSGQYRPVVFDAQVMTRNRNASGRSPSRFRDYRERRRQEVTYFSHELPLSIILMLDVSQRSTDYS